MLEKNPLEKIPPVKVQRVPEVFSVADQFLFDATESPEVVDAFKSSSDEKISCKAIAEALQVMLVKENRGILEQWKLDLMAVMIFERLSSN